MKKQALKAITMLVSIIVLAFVTAIASNAQTPGLKLKAHVPFDFVVGDKTLAAGEYTVGQLTTTSNAGIAISDRDGHIKASRLTTVVQADARNQKTALTFRRHGETYYLAEVWLAGSSEGREVPKSRAERSAERELAQNSKPLIVTIAAVE